MALSREAILQANDIQTVEVPVPEWGGSVLVRGLTGAQRDSYEASLMQGKGKNRDINFSNARAKLVVMACVDGDGARIFADSDLPALAAKSASALNRVWDAARNLSGLGDEDVEQLVGNSESGPSDDSGFASL